jgi:hypothetical protein
MTYIDFAQFDRNERFYQDGEYAKVRPLPHIKKELHNQQAKIIRFAAGSGQYLVEVGGKEYVLRPEELAPIQQEPIRGKIKLENGTILDWSQFAETEEEAIRIVTAQYVHSTHRWVDCWVVK